MDGPDPRLALNTIAFPGEGKGEGKEERTPTEVEEGEVAEEGRWAWLSLRMYPFLCLWYLFFCLFLVLSFVLHFSADWGGGYSKGEANSDGRAQ